MQAGKEVEIDYNIPNILILSTDGVDFFNAKKQAGGEENMTRKLENLESIASLFNFVPLWHMHAFFQFTG